jgi:thioredoxin reductase (NADPH)
VHVAAAGAHTYIGDIAAFTGEPTITAAVAVEPTEALMFERSALRRMVADWPEFGEMIFRTLLARRAWHEEHGYGVMRLIAPQASRRAFEVRDLLERNLLPVHWYDVDNDPESLEMLNWLEIPKEETPVLMHAREVLRNPSPAQVARSLGLRAEVDGQRFDLVVLGAGPAGWRRRSTAARRGCGRWWSSPGRPAARPGPARGSRTTSASQPGSPAAS